MVSKTGGRDSADSAARKVYRGILQGLETKEIVPGQRLIETDLAAQFGVGRNAVREAMQRLAARGVIDLSRYRSAAIRQLDLEETMEVLDVAEAMIGLVFKAAAERYRASQHRGDVEAALKGLKQAHEEGEVGGFSRARRHFYRTMLAIGGNRELMRVFPAIGTHIINAKYDSPRFERMRLADYTEICDAIRRSDGKAAEKAGWQHVQNVRDTIREQHASR